MTKEQFEKMTDECYNRAYTTWKKENEVVSVLEEKRLVDTIQQGSLENAEPIKVV